MADVNYYELLSVSQTATADEIKRAYARKRREFQNDEEKTILLTQAHEVLLHPEQRRDYDNQSKYGEKVGKLWEAYNNAKSGTEKREILADIKKIYEEINANDGSDPFVLKKLFEIAIELGEGDELPYLDKIYNIVYKNEKISDRVRWLEFLGEQYELYDKNDEAIKAYYLVYKTDPTSDAITSLADLLYKEKKNIKAAIQILNDCINRVSDDALKAKYYCKAYEVVGSLSGDNYDKVKKVLLAKVGNFSNKGEEEKLQIAVQVLTAMAMCLDNKQLESYSALEQQYRNFEITNEALDNLYKALQEYEKALKANKYHECIELLIMDDWTDSIRERIGKMLVKDIDAINVAIDYLEKYASHFWALKEEEFNNIKSIVKNNYSSYKEYSMLSSNSNLSSELKTMIKCLVLDGIVRFIKAQDKFNRASDVFFSDDRINQSRQELVILERLYPECYKQFSNVFFDGQSTRELFGQQADTTLVAERVESEPVFENTNNAPYYPNAKDGYEYKRYISGFLDLIMIIIATCCLPPVLPIIFIVKYYNRHEKTIKKWIKPTIIIACVIATIVVVVNVGGAIKSYVDEKKEEKYQEQHNRILNEAELEKLKTLTKKYINKTDIEIQYIQVAADGDGVLPENSPYIYLVCIDYGNRTSQGEFSLYSNCLYQDERDSLSNEISKLINDDELTDYEFCEASYDTILDFVKNNDITYNHYNGIVNQQNQLEQYAITKEGTYNVNYDGGLKPGNYKVWFTCDSPNYTQPELQVNRDGRYADSLNAINLLYGNGDISLQDGDEVVIKVTGWGADNFTFTLEEQLDSSGASNQDSNENDGETDYTYDNTYENEPETRYETYDDWYDYSSGEFLTIDLNEVYDVFNNNISIAEFKDAHPNGVLSYFDNVLVECTGYLGSAKGWLHYGSGIPVYGIGDENSEYDCVSWSSESGTQCSTDYILSHYDLDYVDSGSRKTRFVEAEISIYTWENKLAVIVNQVNELDGTVGHTLIQIVPMANYSINYW